MNPLPLVAATLRRHIGAFALFTALIACAVALGVAVSASERALRRGRDHRALDHALELCSWFGLAHAVGDKV